MPKLTEAHFAARRKQILEATFRCLARTGYSRLTTRDIAAEAGISVGTLYLHFENKQGIVNALSEQGRDRTEAGIETMLVDGSPLGNLGSVFDFVIGRLDDPDSAAVLRVDVELWAEAMHHPALQEMFRASQSHWLDRLSQLVADAQKAGELSEGVDPSDLARLLMATVTGLELQKVMEPDVPLGPLAEAFRALLGGSPDPERMPGTD